MNYFRSFGGILILLGVIALETLFGAGIWFMISVGLSPALGAIYANWLALIVAPVIAIMAIVMFCYGHELKRIILEYEAVHGKEWNEDAQVYFEPHSATWIVNTMKSVVVIADTAGIIYRILLENSVSPLGKILLFIVFEALAISPWLVGTLVHIVAHRPIHAIRADFAYERQVIEANNEMDDVRKAQKARRKTIPPTARHAPQIAAPQGESSPLVQPRLATSEQVSLNQNGKINQ